MSVWAKEKEVISASRAARWVFTALIPAQGGILWDPVGSFLLEAELLTDIPWALQKSVTEAKQVEKQD